MCLPVPAHPRPMPPPYAGGTRGWLKGLRPAAWKGGNPFPEGLNYFAPQETGPWPYFAEDSGGKCPNQRWGKETRWSVGWDRAQRAPPRARNTFSRPQPQQLLRQSWVKRILLLGLATGQGLETLSRWWPLSPRDFSERQRARERVPLGD